MILVTIHGAHLVYQVTADNPANGWAVLFTFITGPAIPDKQTIRRAAKLVRGQAAKFAHAEDYANAACHFFGGPLANWHGTRKPVVAAYWPMSHEFDCRPLMGYLHEAGYRLVLPTVLGGRVLSFRSWSHGLTLEPDTMNMPSPAASAETVTPDIVIVPLLAFTRRGDRIGYGGGYYDATIRDLRQAGPVLAAGLAYAAQEIDDLPTEPHDEKLDWMVTESFARRAALS